MPYQQSGVLQSSLERIAVTVKNELHLLAPLSLQGSDSARHVEFLTGQVARAYERAALQLLSGQKLPGLPDGWASDQRVGPRLSDEARTIDRATTGVSTPDGTPPTRSISDCTHSPAGECNNGFSLPTFDVLSAPSEAATRNSSKFMHGSDMTVSARGCPTPTAAMGQRSLWPDDSAFVSLAAPEGTRPSGVPPEPSIDVMGSGDNLPGYVVPGAVASTVLLKSVHAALAAGAFVKHTDNIFVKPSDGGEQSGETSSSSTSRLQLDTNWRRPMTSMPVVGERRDERRSLDAGQGAASTSNALSSSLMAQHNLLQQVARQQQQQNLSSAFVQSSTPLVAPFQSQQQFLFQPQQQENAQQQAVFQVESNGDTNLLRFTEAAHNHSAPTLASNSRNLSYQVDPSTGNLVAIVTPDLSSDAAYFTGLNVNQSNSFLINERTSAPSISSLVNGSNMALSTVSAQHTLNSGSTPLVSAQAASGISEPLPLLVNGTTGLGLLSASDSAYNGGAGTHMLGPSSVTSNGNLFAATLLAGGDGHVMSVPSGSHLYQSVLAAAPHMALLEMPGRFKALPMSVQQRIVSLCRVNPVISIRDFDDKVVSKLSLLVDSWGADQAMSMLEHLEQRMRTKHGAMKNGPGYLDVAVCSHLDMLKAQGSCPKSMKLDEYAQQVLPPSVFHELCEAVASNRWLSWDHFDQGIIQLVKRLPIDSAVEKLKEIAYHSFKNVDNIKGCIMSILNSRIREDRRRL